MSTGDFNCRSTQWWENDIENNEGKLFEPITADIGFHQLISEPTHIICDSKYCIDLTFTDQPNLFIESGVDTHRYLLIPAGFGTMTMKWQTLLPL